MADDTSQLGTEETRRRRSYNFMDRLRKLGLNSHMYDYRTGRVSLSFDEFEALLAAAESGEKGLP